ncbi:hypothetical protein CP500_021755 [Tychonema bourrellyi FEM_GT703]|uniref:Uncharacterized protein n=1 Tax=Tychonema bourrellyi FEM_GT703 TaxID=2040638 RepID=A0A2G4EV79_9CYAN|nr:hypothetical protein CP500_021755 [Tychonema bourrellyi FEM_GT703]
MVRAVGRKKEEGRGKREGATIAMVSEIKNVLNVGRGCGALVIYNCMSFWRSLGVRVGPGFQGILQQS